MAGLRVSDTAGAVGAVGAPVRATVLALAAMVLVQMGLGGMVSSNYAGLACTEWPTCNGGVWFPVWNGIVGLQLFHRLGAYTLAALAVGFLVLARGHERLRRPAALVLALVLCQVGVGVANVLLAMPVEIAILHSAVADLIVLSTTWALVRTLALPVAHGVASAAIGAAPERA